MFCRVVTSSRSKGIGNGLTYELADGDAKQGFPVRVPLRNQLVEGIIVEVLGKRSMETFDVKQAQAILTNMPLLTPAQMTTAIWMSQYYMTTVRQALNVWLPPPPWSGVLPKDEVGYTITQNRDLIPVRGKNQLAILDYLIGGSWISREELRKEAAATPQMLRTLREKGLIHEEVRKPEAPALPRYSEVIRTLPILSTEQEAAYDSIRTDPRTSLLFGVTGSGKTEIYAQLIVDALRAGRQALLLVPEILLTEHSISRFELLLDRSSIAVLHSKLTQKQRRDEWQRIACGDVALVIGSRSALFAPLHHLGLIILDEEHEWTFKNEQTPRYHARETAEVLARTSKAKVVLGSATPSLESWSRAKTGIYNLVRLPHRFREQPLPAVKIIDLATVQFGKLYPFSLPLLTAIADRLKKGEQSVLFLNRRGVASALLCRTCRRRVVSPESQLPYTVHHTSAGRPYLLDHMTGSRADVPANCPHCNGTDLLSIGAGTQKLELILGNIFPTARIIRADADTMQDPLQMRAMLETMKSRQADILLGTQSVVKGLDLPGVTLAAVLLADLGLSLPHFRAGERVFQLLTQLTGRSGRAQDGEVIIQTFRPDSPEILAASKHETEKYMNDELKLRTFGEYPPATKMIRLLVRGDDAAKRAKQLHAAALAIAAKDHNDAKIYVAQTLFDAGKIWHVLLRGSSPRAILSQLDLEDVVIDVDPIETL